MKFKLPLVSDTAVPGTIIALFLHASIAHASCTVTDDSGHQITLEKPAQRIISLAPDLTETLFSIGAGKQIIGVMQGSDYPLAARHITPVGSYTGLDLEKIISLHPDLIVIWGTTFTRQLDVLRKMGIPVYQNEPRRLEDVARTMTHLGCLAGTERSARESAQAYTRGLAKIRAAYSQQKPVTVFYQIGPYSLITINKNSWINQALTICGGRNVFADALSIAPEVSWEAVVAAKPEVIISDAVNPDWKQRWQSWHEIPAVSHGFLFAIPPDLMERAGPRLLAGTRYVCSFLQQARPH